MRIYQYHNSQDESSAKSLQRMRFYDERHNLKIVLTPEAVYYITAEENYVNIYYVENGTVHQEPSLNSSGHTS